MNQIECVPTLEGDKYVFVIDGDIEDCGTNVINNGTHVTYENAVQSTVGQENAVISRKRMMKVNFSCMFDLEQTLSLADAIMPKIQHFEVIFSQNLRFCTKNTTLFKDRPTFLGSLCFKPRFIERWL